MIYGELERMVHNFKTFQADAWKTDETGENA